MLTYLMKLASKTTNLVNLSKTGKKFYLTVYFLSFSKGHAQSNVIMKKKTVPHFVKL